MFQGECRLKSGRVRVLLTYEFASDIEANYIFSLKTYVKHLIMYVRFVYVRLCRSMSQSVGRWPFTTEVRVCSQARPCDMCREQSGIGTGFDPPVSVFIFVYYSTNASSSYFIYLPWTILENYSIIKYNFFSLRLPKLHYQTVTYILDFLCL